MMKMALGLIKTHTDNGTSPYVDAEKYITGWAHRMAGQPLRIVAKAALPSPAGMNRELAEAYLTNEIGLYDTYMGTQSVVAHRECTPVLYKYETVVDGKPAVVFAGAEFEEAYLTFREFAGFGQMMGFGPMGGLGPMAGSMAGMAGKAMSSFQGMRDLFSGGLDAVREAGSGMSMSEWMRGGLVGKMMREKKAAQRAQEEQAMGKAGQRSQRPQEEQARGNAAGTADDTGKRADLVIFGAQRRYFCMCAKEKEEEATAAFVRFVGSIQPDPKLAAKEDELLRAKLGQLQQEAAMSQAMAQQSQMRLRQLQQQTTQMLAQNSRDISAGIMDSWDKRQASESRISAGFSEAIRGVNTYATPSGGTVEARVAADHVYQNRYGDIISVSGNAVDEQTAARLDWTELEKQ